MTKSWVEIIKHYKDLQQSELNIDFTLKLVEQINKSNYAKGLYAWTSMHDLCIVQNEVKHPYDGPYLRIHPLYNGSVEFRYIDILCREKQWSRTVDEEKLFVRLEMFLEQLHWFVIESNNNES